MSALKKRYQTFQLQIIADKNLHVVPDMRVSGPAGGGNGIVEVRMAMVTKKSRQPAL